MTGRRNVILWLGLCLSLPAAAYASLGVVYFSWLEGVERWPDGSAAMLAFGCLALAILCAAIFILSLVSLFRRRKGRRS